MKKSLKLLSLVLAAIMLLSLAPVSAFAAGETANDAHAIYDAEDFMAITSGNSYYLANDIDFSEETITTPYVIENFWGNIDGRGFALKNITLNITSNPDNDTNLDVGIFGYVGGDQNTDGNTVITNLKVQGLSITVNDEKMTITTNINIGGLLGCTDTAHAVLVRNVNINANIKVTRTNTKGGHIAVGGIAGKTKQLDVTNSSFSGSIEVSTSGNVNSTYIGGIVGLLDTYNGYGAYTTLKNCANSASITLTHTVNSITKEYGVGGIVGYAKDTVYVLDCVNSGAVTSNQSGVVGGFIGVINAYKGNTLAVIADSVNRGYVSVSALADVTSADIYGTAKNRESFIQRTFVFNCKTLVDNVKDDEIREGTLVEKSLPITEAKEVPADIMVKDDGGNDGYNHDYIISLSTGDEFKDIGTKYPEDAFYILVDNINLGYSKDSYCNGHVIDSFNGVLYGNGKTIDGLYFSGGGKMALINKFAYNFHTAVLDLKFGSASSPVVFNTGNGAECAILAQFIGSPGTNTYTDKTSALVSNVDFYVNLSGNNCKWFGAVGAYSHSNHGIYDCNVYGDVKLSAITAEANLNAYVSLPQGKSNSDLYVKSITAGCNDFVDYTAKVSTGAQKVRMGGLGYTNPVSCVLIDCNSFGDKVAEAGDNQYIHLSAFMAAFKHSYGSASIVNCSNFGMISGGKSNVLGIADVAQNGTASRYFNLNDYSSSTVGMTGIVVSGYTAPTAVCCSDNGTVSVDAPVMKDGASVRIDPNPANAGLRFRATVSEAAIAELKEIYGDEATVSYGIIIAPTLFTKKVTDFTAAKLDEWSNSETMKEAFGDEKAYVDVEASEGYWFKNQPGSIAASVNGLEGLFDAAFSGRAYIKVTVAGVEVYRVYADYSDENNSRVFNDVLESALNDVLYTKDNVNFFTDETCEIAADPAKYDFATYTLELSENDEGVKKCSCYTEAQYADLVMLQTNISNLNNQGE